MDLGPVRSIIPYEFSQPVFIRVRSPTLVGSSVTGPEFLKCPKKLSDALPQRSSSGIVWFRINKQEFRGEICVPSVRDSKHGEIYKCRKCGDFMCFKSSQIPMRSIFEDLAKEIQRKFYANESTFIVRKPKKNQIQIDTRKSPKAVKCLFKWILLLGNVSEYSENKPILVQTICSKKIRKSSISRFSESTDSTPGKYLKIWAPKINVEAVEYLFCSYIHNMYKAFSKSIFHLKFRFSAIFLNIAFLAPKPKAELQNYECSFNIWNIKAKELRHFIFAIINFLPIVIQNHQKLKALYNLFCTFKVRRKENLKVFHVCYLKLHYL